MTNHAVEKFRIDAREEDVVEIESTWLRSSVPRKAFVLVPVAPRKLVNERNLTRVSKVEAY
jgi:hypothetical protein